VAVPNPNHLFEQAVRLVSQQSAGPPRQVDVRRAISSAYYGIFHFTLTKAADQVVGKTRRKTSQYGLVYRSIDHGTLRSLCEEVKKPNLRPKYLRHAPSTGFGQNLQAFAAAVLELQEKRHAADYDPMIRVKRSDAILAVRTARTALRRFDRANPRRQRAFLSLLLFPPR
jgi:hypothetical protein